VNKQLFLLLSLFLLPSFVGAETFYAAPDGEKSATSCPKSEPCTLDRAMTLADKGGDVVRLLDGIYSYVFRTKHSGSNKDPITIEAVNRHLAVIRFNGLDNKSDIGGRGVQIELSNIVFRGIRLDCTSGEGTKGANAHDCIRVGAIDPNFKKELSPIKNILIEDVWGHDVGHLMFGCYDATDVELRHSQFDRSGIDDHQGEANYFASAHNNRECHRLNHHHNIFSRYMANAIDMKSQTRDIDVHDNLFIDKLQHPSKKRGSGDGEFITGRHPNNRISGTKEAGNYVRDNINIRTIHRDMFGADDGHRCDYIGNVILDWKDDSKGGILRANKPEWNPSQAISSNNIFCNAQVKVDIGVDRDGGQKPNLLNRPRSECLERIDEILGVPRITSCEIGGVNDHTVIVNIQAEKNGPVSSVGDLKVVYDEVSQTEQSVEQISDQQARIVMVSPPASRDVKVRVIARPGSIQNSAYLGGKTCGNGNNVFKPKLNGNGICGENKAEPPTLCTNKVKGEDGSGS